MLLQPLKKLLKTSCMLLTWCCHHVSGNGDREKRKLVQQLLHLNASYNGGLAAYIQNAKQLLEDSKEGDYACLITVVQQECFGLLAARYTS